MMNNSLIVSTNINITFDISILDMNIVLLSYVHLSVSEYLYLLHLTFLLIGVHVLYSFSLIKTYPTCILAVTSSNCRSRLFRFKLIITKSQSTRISNFTHSASRAVTVFSSHKLTNKICNLISNLISNLVRILSFFHCKVCKFTRYGITSVKGVI